MFLTLRAKFYASKIGRKLEYEAISIRHTNELLLFCYGKASNIHGK